jgi:hypothetical protein
VTLGAVDVVSGMLVAVVLVEVVLVEEVLDARVIDDRLVPYVELRLLDEVVDAVDEVDVLLGDGFVC